MRFRIVTAGMLAVALSAGVLADGSSAEDGLAPLAWLAGSCWTGTFADGKAQDLVCYDWMLGGKFLRSRHRVVGGPQPYSGETILAQSPNSGELEFTYFNSLGGIVRGRIEPTAEGLRFPDEIVEMGGETFELRSVWRREGEDRYVAVTEKKADGEWRPMMTIEFERSGPSADWERRDPAPTAASGLDSGR